MDNQQHLEVVFSTHQSGLKATCSAFPKCHGIGRTEREALLRLSKSISTYIAEMAQSGMDDILLSEHFTEVISDPFKNRDRKKRLFSLIPNGLDQKNLMVKLKNIKELESRKNKKAKEVETMVDFENRMVDRLLNILNPTGYPTSSESNSDGMEFGFPISYN